MAAPEKFVTLAAALGAALYSAAGAAAETGARLPDVLVVTGMRERPLALLPRSAVVIDEAEIALAPALSVPDLLADQANITLRSVTGNDRFSGVDIRGQGDTYTSNVVVMLDGVRLNNADLSGADFSIVPLDRIERVEVIRGAGTVRYGNGAVGGVVNIITREPGEGLAVTARGRIGSYGRVDSGADAAFGTDTYFAAVGASASETDGYRDNGALDKQDVGGEVGFMPTDWFSVGARADLHDDRYGLPGPVSEADYFGSAAARRATRFPEDGGRTEDDRYRLRATLGNSRTGELQLVSLTRDRVNDYTLSGSPGTISEDSERYDAQYSLDIEAFGRRHTVYAGGVSEQADYARITDFSQPDVAGEANVIGSLRHQAWFVAADAGITDTVQLSLGFRSDSFRVRGVGQELLAVCDVLFGTPPNQICLDPGGFRNELVSGSAANSYRSSALEAGLVYSPSARLSWFLAYAQSFRNPNVDELVLADDDLGPQQGEHWDAGVRFAWTDSLDVSLAVFHVETDDEILFAVDDDLADDGGSVFLLGRNFNAEEPTERVGGEAELTWYATADLRLTANAGYTRAEFRESGRTLPLVPEWTAAVGAQQQFLTDFTLSVTATHVGSRYDGNDFANSGATLDSYQVVDARLVYERDELTLHAGVNNLFDEVYATSVYSSNYYPMPERNFYAGFSIALQSP